MRGDLRGQLAEREGELRCQRFRSAKTLAEILQQKAERLFAVGLSDRSIAIPGRGIKMCKVPLWAKIQ